jgi:hypothetical protein
MIDDPYSVADLLSLLIITIGFAQTLPCEHALQMFWTDTQKALAWISWLMQSTLTRTTLHASYGLYPSWVALKKVISIMLSVENSL